MADRERVTVKLSETKSLVIMELDALESMIADSYASKMAVRVGETTPSEAMTMKAYAICSVREVDGEKVNPLANMAEFMGLASSLRVSEIPMLLEEVVKQFGIDINALKNEPAPQPSTA